MENCIWRDGGVQEDLVEQGASKNSKKYSKRKVFFLLLTVLLFLFENRREKNCIRKGMVKHNNNNRDFSTPNSNLIENTPKMFFLSIFTFLWVWELIFSINYFCLSNTLFLFWWRWALVTGAGDESDRVGESERKVSESTKTANLTD